jgi:hypothetical protein
MPAAHQKAMAEFIMLYPVRRPLSHVQGETLKGSGGELCPPFDAPDHLIKRKTEHDDQTEI